MNVTFSHSENITPSIKTLWFKPEAPVRYQAGQFTELHLEHESPDDRGIRRWFTLSSSPTEPLVAITTKFVDNGSSFKGTLSAIQPGVPLKLADPMGDFVLPKDTSIPLTFVAGGMGISPVRSIVKWLLDTGESRDVQIIYSASQPEDLAFDELFKSSGFKYTTVVTNSENSSRLTTERILDLGNFKNNGLIYLSGPEIMIETLNGDLIAAGIDDQRIVPDFFPGYTAI
jgi:ferredoxin-NADP reductase